jgi:hypothetical protein
MKTTLEQFTETTETERDKAWELHQELEERIDILESLAQYDLADAICEQLGCDTAEELIDTLKDVSRGGANAGFSGFIYHGELLEFFQANKSELIKLLEEESKSLGESGVVEFIKSFRCLQDTETTIEDIGKVLFGDSTDPSIVDSVCWFALETVAFCVDR